MKPITFAELATLVYFYIDASKYLTADESEFTEFALDTELGYLRKGDKVYFIFKGSCSMIDWVYNFKVGKVDFDYGDFKVHQGINEKFKVTFDYVSSKIKPNDKVFFTGHSLGGALSLLMAYAVKVQLKANIQGVYVFGAPRVGGEGWCIAYNNLLADVTFAYTTEGDIVPSLPPRWLGYYQVGQQISIKGNKCVSAHLPWFYVMGLRN